MKTQTKHYFGACPVCGESDGCLNLGRDHWFYCDQHRTRWWIGSNLFSGWRDEDEETRAWAAEKAGAFRIVAQMPWEDPDGTGEGSTDERRADNVVTLFPRAKG